MHIEQETYNSLLNTIEKYDNIVEGLVAEIKDLHRQMASPPPGWFTLGTHIDPETGKRLDVELDFWGDDGGVPFWERPRPATQ